ncbi:MAG: ABC transporter ATP-binding protein [Candidatus Lindowbacteria bacterium]|nr:ABC transporter ATP-binding protein [Candidatus Lindowbacteria bacterium]
MALLEIKGVSKQFGTRDIIRDLSLSVEEGTIFGFLGPNGAGKTTTIRMITGILKPTTGSISIDGYDLAVDPIGAKLVTGYIPDAPYLYPKLTGWEYLELTADLYRVTDWQERARELLERFDLTFKKDEFIDSFSFGMRQKISILAAVLPKPKLIIVDEPLIGLDPPAARSVKDLFLEETERGAAVFMSTHLLEIAEALCDEVAILDQGESVAVGSIDDLAEKKDQRLEEVFMNLLAARREKGSDERRRWEDLAQAASRDDGRRRAKR